MLTGAELEPLTEGGYTAVGTDSPPQALPLVNALYLHSPSVRHNGVTAPDLHMGAELQGLPRLSLLPGSAADLRGFLSTTSVLGVNRE